MITNSRIKAYNVLKTFTQHVYYQDPGNISMIYPCIVYSREGADTKYANGYVYGGTYEYKVTFMSKNPDDPILDKMSRDVRLRYDTEYKADGIYHCVFNINI